MRRSVHLCVCPSVCPFVFLLLYLFVCSPVHMPSLLPVYPSVPMPVYPSMVNMLLVSKIDKRFKFSTNTNNSRRQVSIEIGADWSRDTLTVQRKVRIPRFSNAKKIRFFVFLLQAATNATTNISLFSLYIKMEQIERACPKFNMHSFLKTYATPKSRLRRVHKVYIFLNRIKFWINLCVCLSLCLSACPSAYLSEHLSICLSVDGLVCITPAVNIFRATKNYVGFKFTMNIEIWRRFLMKIVPIDEDILPQHKAKWELSKKQNNWPCYSLLRNCNIYHDKILIFPIIDPLVLAHQCKISGLTPEYCTISRFYSLRKQL